MPAASVAFFSESPCECHSSNARTHRIGGSSSPLNGRRLQQSTGTSDERKAREYHDKLKASLWDQDRLGIKPSRSWNEAVVRYLAETTHKASQSDDKAHLRWVDKFLGGVELRSINREVLDR